MEKYSYVLIITIAAAFLFLAFFLVFSDKTSLNPEECKVILENEGENKIDIVFLTDNVEKDKVNDYVDFLLDSGPFVNNKDKFNFFYAGNVDCKIDDEMLLCYSKNLIKKSSACKNDYIIVLSKQKSSVRSSAYMNVVSINTNHPKSVFLHEFGHVFANLADEYVPSSLPRKSKNCQSDCDKFEIKDSCYEGCTKATLFRSSDSSVMRTLKTSDYKKLNTLIIENELDKYE